MEWQDEAIVIRTAKQGNNALIVDIMTKERGICSGIIRGVKNALPICQPGNKVEVRWSGRLAEQLGRLEIDLIRTIIPAIFQDAMKMHAVTAISMLLSRHIPPRQTDQILYASCNHFFDVINIEQDPLVWLATYVEFELYLLSTLGYGLDVSTCAGAGEPAQLVYVSPKTGRSVCKFCGAPWHNRLLHLPPWLRPQTDKTSTSKPIDIREIIDGLTLTRYFLDKCVLTRWERSGFTAREQMMTLIMRQHDELAGMEA